MMKPHALLGFVVLMSAFAAPAHAWDPFVTPNSNVETGNERMSAGDAAGALAAYDLAARQHPEEPRVALDRGLALLASGDLPAAREAFVSAADPDADDEIRAAAYYDLGLAFYREGDAAVAEDDHEASQGFFREAADAFRRSLRVIHGNRDAAWNLELALRRIREEEEAQEQQEEQERQEQEEQEEGDEEGDPQEGDEQGDQQEGDEQGDPQEGDEEGDQQGGDEQSDEEGNEGEGDEGEQDQQGGDEEGDEGQEGEDPQEQSGEQEGEGEDPDGGDDQADQHPDQGEQQEGAQNLPSHVERVLDALQDNEQNLERARARARAAREGRRVLRDW